MAQSQADDTNYCDCEEPTVDIVMQRGTAHELSFCECGGIIE